MKGLFLAAPCRPFYSSEMAFGFTGKVGESVEVFSALIEIFFPICGPTPPIEMLPCKGWLLLQPAFLSQELPKRSHYFSV